MHYVTQEKVTLGVTAPTSGKKDVKVSLYFYQGSFPMISSFSTQFLKGRSWSLYSIFVPHSTGCLLCASSPCSDAISPWCLLAWTQLPDFSTWNERGVSLAWGGGWGDVDWCTRRSGEPPGTQVAPWGWPIVLTGAKVFCGFRSWKPCHSIWYRN